METITLSCVYSELTNLTKMISVSQEIRPEISVNTLLICSIYGKDYINIVINFLIMLLLEKPSHYANFSGSRSQGCHYSVIVHLSKL